MLREIAAGITYERFARVFRHFAAYCLTGLLCYWLNEIYRLASPNVMAPALLAIISAVTMYDAAGFRGLRMWTRRGGETQAAGVVAASTDIMPPPSTDESERAGSGRAE